MPTFRESMAAGARLIGPQRNDPIELADYDAAWPGRFEQMRARLAAALGDTARRIDHVGSTAVPGLAAKPVIDIQVSVPDVEDEAAFRAPIEAQGFGMRWIELGHRYFRPPAAAAARLPGPRVHHRQRLGARPRAVSRLPAQPPGNGSRVRQLKRDLASRYTWNRIGYNDAKGPFIESVVDRAQEWAAASGWTP